MRSGRKRRRQNSSRASSVSGFSSIKEQCSKPLRSVKGALQSRVPGHKRIIGAVAAIEVHAPARARLRFGAAEFGEWDANFRSPDAGLLVGVDCRFEAAFPIEISLIGSRLFA